MLAIASYSILVAVMLLTGRLVARETGADDLLGLVAMVLVGTTSLMLAPAIVVLGRPACSGRGLASWRPSGTLNRTGGRVERRRWLFAAISAPLAGWFWTIGHMAGPVAAVYLWVDGRRRCRLAAAVPLAATTRWPSHSWLAVWEAIASTAPSASTAAPAREAFSPVQGLYHTGQAISENLVFGNLGLTVHTTPAQGAVLSLGLILLWSSRWWLSPASLALGTARRSASLPAAEECVAAGPLECTGGVLVVGSYWVEWTFRGYMDYQYLRTISLRVFVPWYDAVPQIGAVLLVTGWWAATGR